MTSVCTISDICISENSAVPIAHNGYVATLTCRIKLSCKLFPHGSLLFVYGHGQSYRIWMFLMIASFNDVFTFLSASLSEATRLFSTTKKDRELLFSFKSSEDNSRDIHGWRIYYFYFPLSITHKRHCCIFSK